MIKAYGVAHVWKTLRKSVQEKLKKQLHKQKKATILNNLPISSTNEASENKQPTEQRHSDRVRIRKKSAFQQQEICGEEARRLAGMRSRLDIRPIDQETGEGISGSHQRIRMMLNALQELARQDAAAALGVLHRRVGKAFCREQSFRKSILSLSFPTFSLSGGQRQQKENKRWRTRRPDPIARQLSGKRC